MELWDASTTAFWACVVEPGRLHGCTVHPVIELRLKGACVAAGAMQLIDTLTQDSKVGLWLAQLREHFSTQHLNLAVEVLQSAGVLAMPAARRRRRRYACSQSVCFYTNMAPRMHVYGKVSHDQILIYMSDGEKVCIYVL